MNKKLTLQDCIDFAKSKEGYCLSANYMNNKTNMLWKCKYDKHPAWLACFDNIKNSNRWCRFCIKEYTLQDCIDIAIQKGGYSLSKEYIRIDYKMQWQCNKGHTWISAFRKIIDGCWCPKCAIDKKRLTIDECNKLANSKDGKCLSSEYKNNKQLLTWQCSKGHIWESRYNDIKRGDWCSYCPITVSQAQKEIYEILREKHNSLQIILNDRQVLKPKHLDVFMPQLKLAIEYDGEYWHYSDWAIKNGSLLKMRIKDELYKNIGINLIRIRESDWKNNPSTIINNISNIIDNLS